MDGSGKNNSSKGGSAQLLLCNKWWKTLGSRCRAAVASPALWASHWTLTGNQNIYPRVVCSRVAGWLSDYVSKWVCVWVTNKMDIVGGWTGSQSEMSRASCKLSKWPENKRTPSVVPVPSALDSHPVKESWKGYSEFMGTPAVHRLNSFASTGVANSPPLGPLFPYCRIVSNEASRWTHPFGLRFGGNRNYIIKSLFYWVVRVH